MTLEMLVDAVAEFEGCPINKEGFCIPYKDAAGVSTIGYGFTDNESLTTRMTKDDAKLKLRFKLKNLSEIVEKTMKRFGYVGLNYNQIYALTDFVYNLGLGKLTTLTNNGSRSLSEVSDAILLYNKAAGNTLPGLVKRRKWEKELFDKNLDTFILNDYTVIELQRLINLKIKTQHLNMEEIEVDGIIGRKTINTIYNILKQ